MPTDTLAANKSKLFELLKTQAFFREKIVLSSGKMSDYYFDARRVTLSAAGAYLSAKIILEMIKNDRAEHIGGPTLGADPLVGALGVLSYQMSQPLATFIIRKSPKAHGIQQQIEGPVLSPGARVILIDDVATTGKALVESLEILKRLDIMPLKAVCLIDRQEGARDALAKFQCPLESIFTEQDFLK